MNEKDEKEFEESALHYLDNKKFVTYDSPFLNSDALFVEFNDVLTSPFFIFIWQVHDNAYINEIFNFDSFKGKNVSEIYDWYIRRRHRNPLLDIPLREGVFEKIFRNNKKEFINWTWEFLYKELDALPEIMQFNSTLNFFESLKIAAPQPMIKQTYVYSEYPSETIKTWLDKNYHLHVSYVSGDLKEILKENNITYNSTFVFSDITKINILKEMDLLKFSSILLADKYDYNYKEDNSDYIINIDGYLKETSFKFDCFDNINKTVDDNE